VKFITIVLVAWALMLSPLLLLAQEQVESKPDTEQSQLTAETAFGTGVTERMPVGEAESFPADVGKVYFWTKVMGAESPTTVNHVWYYQGKEMASVSLSVRDKSWRTWSYKTILPKWTGKWTVVVTDAMGKEVSTSTFTITEQ
jgi:hypothetical protein